MKGHCAFCGHTKYAHNLTKHVKPDGTKGYRTKTGCSLCVCRKYESP